jgi:hypothetical protein
MSRSDRACVYFLGSVALSIAYGSVFGAAAGWAMFGGLSCIYGLAGGKR